MPNNALKQKNAELLEAFSSRFDEQRASKNIIRRFLNEKESFIVLDFGYCALP